METCHRLDSELLAEALASSSAGTVFNVGTCLRVSAHDAFCEHGFLSIINYGAVCFTRLWVSVREAIGELRPIRDFVSYGHAGFLLRPYSPLLNIRQWPLICP